MKTLVFGGREYKDRDFLYSCLDRLNSKHGITLIIEGGALGADRLARQWAFDRGIPVCTFHADWTNHGRRAGPIRNRSILELGSPECAVKFKGGRGTHSMSDLLKNTKVLLWDTTT